MCTPVGHRYLYLITKILYKGVYYCLNKLFPHINSNRTFHIAKLSCSQIGPTLCDVFNAASA